MAGTLYTNIEPNTSVFFNLFIGMEPFGASRLIDLHQVHTTKRICVYIHEKRCKDIDYISVWSNDISVWI